MWWFHFRKFDFMLGPKFHPTSSMPKLLGLHHINPQRKIEFLDSTYDPI